MQRLSIAAINRTNSSSEGDTRTPVKEQVYLPLCPAQSEHSSQYLIGGLVMEGTTNVTC